MRYGLEIKVDEKMNKDKLLEYIEIMCKRCIKHGWCVDMGKGNWCTPKKEIKKYIEKGQ